MSIRDDLEKKLSVQFFHVDGSPAFAAKSHNLMTVDTNGAPGAFADLFPVENAWQLDLTEKDVAKVLNYLRTLAGEGRLIKTQGHCPYADTMTKLNAYDI